MKKMKRYEDGGDVDYDKDSDPEAQKVYRRDLTEVSDEERMPRRAAASVPKKSAPRVVSKPAASSRKASEDYVPAARNKYTEARGYDEASKNKNLSSEDRRAMLGRYAQAMKDYDTLGRASKYAEGKGMKKGGSVKSSASRRADGIAQRGKTRGRVI